MSASGCSPETLVSVSFMARARFQSLLETFEEDGFFIASRNQRLVMSQAVIWTTRCGYLGETKR